MGTLLMETCQYAHQHAFQPVGQVVDDVPSIGNLHGATSSTGRGAGVLTISVSARYSMTTRMVSNASGNLGRIDSNTNQGSSSLVGSWVFG